MKAGMGPENELRRKTFRKNALLLILPLLLWWGEVSLRPRITVPVCGNNPLSCGTEKVNPFDRFAMGESSKKAHDISTLTQNLTGVAAGLATMSWQIAQISLTGLSPGRAILHGLADWVLLTRTAVWNGTLMEFLRITLQRPRPFVMRDPVGYGGNPSHYTSFYSGHTSFSFAMAMGGFLLLRRARVPRRAVAGFAIAVFSLAAVTGILRVVAQAHYMSDVLVGAIAGSFFAWLSVRGWRRLN